MLHAIVMHHHRGYLLKCSKFLQYSLSCFSAPWCMGCWLIACWALIRNPRSSFTSAELHWLLPNIRIYTSDIFTVQEINNTIFHDSYWWFMLVYHDTHIQWDVSILDTTNDPNLNLIAQSFNSKWTNGCALCKSVKAWLAIYSSLPGLTQNSFCSMSCLTMCVCVCVCVYVCEITYGDIKVL